MWLVLLGFYLGVAACVFTFLRLADRANGEEPTAETLLTYAAMSLIWPVMVLR